jgi:hypothetical protein
MRNKSKVKSQKSKGESFSVRVPQVRYSEPVLRSEPRGTGLEYRTRGTRKLDRDVTLATVLASYF